MTDECMAAPSSFTEQYFDDSPPSRGKRAHLAQIGSTCVFCRAPISPLSDYGWFDFGLIDGDDDEPEWLSCCWGCKRPIVYAMEER